MVKLKSLPSLSWVRARLRYGIRVAVRRKVLAAYVVGSFARGRATEKSDVDIAVIINPVKGKSSLKYTENYHGHFTSNSQYPTWEGHRVDFQFFYPTDPELKRYQKIPLPPR